MAKYVLLHGGISFGSRAGALGVHTLPSDKPEEPTVLDLEPEEAAKLNGNVAGQLLPSSRDKGPALMLLAEYEASRAGEKAKAEAIAKAKHGAVAKAEEKHGKAAK